MVKRFHVSEKYTVFVLSVTVLLYKNCSLLVCTSVTHELAEVCTWTTGPDFEFTFVCFFVTRQQNARRNYATVCMKKMSKQIPLIH